MESFVLHIPNIIESQSQRRLKMKEHQQVNAATGERKASWLRHFIFLKDIERSVVQTCSELWM